MRDCHHVEDMIYINFQIHFEQQPDYGREYFMGDAKQMIQCINQIIDETNQKLDDELIDELKEKYKNYLKFRLHDVDDISDTISDELIEDYKNDPNDYTIKPQKQRKKK